MGRLVLGLATSHIAAITRQPQIAGEDQAARFLDGYGRLRDALAEARADALVIISPDHVNRFFLDTMPAFCIGLRDTFEGPAEQGTGVPHRRLDSHTALADHILRHGLATGIDWTRAEDWVLDHGFMVPLYLLDQDGALPVVPIAVNCAAPPYPSVGRCFAVGRLIAEAIEAYPEDIRVAVIAAGGLSHSPGDERMGFIDEAFDLRFLGLLESGDRTGLLGLADEEIEAAGSSTSEIRSWIALSGMFDGAPFERIFYEPIGPYGTGCGQAIVRGRH